MSFHNKPCKMSPSPASPSGALTSFYSFLHRLSIIVSLLRSLSLRHSVHHDLVLPVHSESITGQEAGISGTLLSVSDDPPDVFEEKETSLPSSEEVAIVRAERGHIRRVSADTRLTVDDPPLPPSLWSSPSTIHIAVAVDQKFLVLCLRAILSSIATHNRGQDRAEGWSSTKPPAPSSSSTRASSSSPTLPDVLVHVVVIGNHSHQLCRSLTQKFSSHLKTQCRVWPTEQADRVAEKMKVISGQGSDACRGGGVEGCDAARAKRLKNVLSFARFFLDDILPDVRERVIWLDSDVLVRKDLRELWSVVGSSGGAVMSAFPEPEPFGRFYIDQKRVVSLLEAVSVRVGGPSESSSPGPNDAPDENNPLPEPSGSVAPVHPAAARMREKSTPSGATFSIRSDFHALFDPLHKHSRTSFNDGAMVLNLAQWRRKNVRQDVLMFLEKHRDSDPGLWKYGTQPLMMLLGSVHGWQRLNPRWYGGDLGFFEAKGVALPQIESNNENLVSSSTLALDDPSNSPLANIPPFYADVASVVPQKRSPLSHSVAVPESWMMKHKITRNRVDGTLRLSTDKSNTTVVQGWWPTVRDSVFLHYNGEAKPWLRPRGIFATLWFHYADMIEWDAAPVRPDNMDEWETPDEDVLQPWSTELALERNFPFPDEDELFAQKEGYKYSRTTPNSRGCGCFMIRNTHWGAMALFEKIFRRNEMDGAGAKIFEKIPGEETSSSSEGSVLSVAVEKHHLHVLRNFPKSSALRYSTAYFYPIRVEDRRNIVSESLRSLVFERSYTINPDTRDITHQTNVRCDLKMNRPLLDGISDLVLETLLVKAGFCIPMLYLSLLAFFWRDVRETVRDEGGGGPPPVATRSSSFFAQIGWPLIGRLRRIIAAKPEERDWWLQRQRLLNSKAQFSPVASPPLGEERRPRPPLASQPRDAPPTDELGSVYESSCLRKTSWSSDNAVTNGTRVFGPSDYGPTVFARYPRPFMMEAEHSVEISDFMSCTDCQNPPKGQGFPSLLPGHGFQCPAVRENDVDFFIRPVAFT